MNFTEHGVFEVKIEEKVLLVDATGPFNEELIIKYENALEACISNLEASNWHQIITLHQLSLFTPEAEIKLTQTLKSRRSRGLVACAVVLKNIEGESLIRAQLSRCYGCAGVEYVFTSSVHDAKKWFAVA
jgi:hypothetical protein